ncbi:MAG TPA: TlpA disulfide reductase family protein, partial [Longimicrobiales bacterium]|nr:TlpA disulfide reductase family protein [Longimicrobiales bacterium]
MAVMVAVLLATSVVPGSSQDARPEEAWGGGAWRLRALDGTGTTLAELADRPVLLNAWATWCGPCVAELRSLERLARSLPDGRV